MSASPTQAIDPNAGLPAGFRPRRGLNWATVGLMYTSYYFCRYNFAYANKAIADEFGYGGKTGFGSGLVDFAFSSGELAPEEEFFGGAADGDDFVHGQSPWKRVVE